MATMTNIQRYLAEIDVVPEIDSVDYLAWIECRDVLPFLQSLKSGDVPALLVSRYAYIYSMLVPSGLLEDGYKEKLKEWNLNPSKGWVFWVSSGVGEEPVGVIDEPINFTRSDILDKGEPVVFVRFCHFRDPREYIDPNQKILHAARAHWHPDRGTFCRIDEHGDIADVIRTVDFDDGYLCTISAEALDEYMFGSDQALALVFDFGRSRHRERESFDWTEVTEELREFDFDNGYALLELDVTPERIEEARLRGFMVFQELQTRPGLIQRHSPDKEPRVPFIINDWKHGVVRTYPGPRVTPEGTPTEEDWPELISPAFFRAEVLTRYRQDPEKYTDNGESISCRGSWFLRSYDINDEGQVHVYLTDLWGLPRSEQLYWKAFNEAPKDGIAQRAIDRDFRVRWWDGFDPLRDLRRLLTAYPAASQNGKDAAIWAPGGRKVEDLFAPLHYVATESRKEWLDQIAALSSVVVEGLSTTHIRAVAQALGCENKDFASIALLKACLQAMGIPGDEIAAIHEPLYELNKLRSKGGGFIVAQQDPGRITKSTTKTFSIVW